MRSLPMRLSAPPGQSVELKNKTDRQNSQDHSKKKHKLNQLHSQEQAVEGALLEAAAVSLT